MPAARLAASGGVALTAGAPGKWAGKEAKHVPVVAKASVGGGLTVTVPHGMEADHFIELIWVLDQDFKPVAAARLAPGMSPQLNFAPPKGTTAVTAFESCNL